MRVKLPELKALIERKLAPRYTPAEIEYISEAIIFAELADRKTHGLLRLLPNRFGPMDEQKSGELKIETLSAVSVRMSGQGYPGMLLSSLAAEKAIELARTHGIGIVSYLGNRSTSGCLTFYVNKIAQAGFIGSIISNCGAFVAPRGLGERLMGTNPLALALPNSKGEPMIVDFGTSEITFGMLAILHEKGLPLPDNTAVDENGDVCTDTARVMKGGALLPFGGHKGFGIALAIELLCGPYIGASFSGLHQERGWGNIAFALNPQILGGNTDELSELVELFLNARRENSPFRFPGTKTMSTYRANLAQGEVDVVDEIYQQLSP